MADVSPAPEGTPGLSPDVELASASKEGPATAWKPHAAAASKEGPPGAAPATTPADSETVKSQSSAAAGKDGKGVKPGPDEATTTAETTATATTINRLFSSDLFPRTYLHVFVLCAVFGVLLCVTTIPQV